MGYRSQVAYTVRFGAESDTVCRQSFYVVLAQRKEDDVAKLVIDELDIDEQNLSINFKADEVKWYDSYPEVQAHERIVEIANEWCNDDDNYSGIWYEHARVGEEIDDNHYWANQNRSCVNSGYAINLSRHVVVDWE